MCVIKVLCFQDYIFSIDFIFTFDVKVYLKADLNDFLKLLFY